MPVVRTYGQQQVNLRPAADTTVNVRPNPDAYGAGLGQGLEQAGVAGLRAAFAIEDQRKAEADKARQQADEVAVLGARNALATWRSSAIYDPHNGALAVKGKDALALPDTVGESFNKTADQIAQGLSGDRQKLAFERERQNMWQDVDLTVKRHVFSEQQAYDQQETKSFVDLTASHAIAHASEPAVVGNDLRRVEAALNDHARRNGIGPDALAQQLEGVRTAIHTGVIDQFLSSDQDRAAQVYFEETKDQISGEAQTRIKKALEAATTQGEGLRGASELWATLGPKTDADPISIDTMEDAARAKYGDDPKTLDSVIRYLRERKAGVDAGRKEREDATTGGLWEMAAQGASLSQITRTPAYRAAQGRVQAQISDYIVNRSEREANRAAAIESRAAAAESRAYTRQQRAEHQKESEGLYMYYQYAKPDVLGQMTDAQVWALSGTLGVENAQRLLEDKRKFSVDRSAALAASIDADQFNELANEAGFNVFGKDKTQDDKAAIGRLRNDVEQAIAAEQTATGAKTQLPRERKEQVMRSVIERKVMVDGWFGDTERIASSVVNQSDQANAYVPLAQIPAPRLAFVTNYLRSMNPAYQRLTDVQIQQRAKAAIQRAYGATMLGLGQDEVLKRLGEAR